MTPPLQRHVGLPELDAVIEALDRCEPDQATRCTLWTVHDLTAHLAAGADEIARHLEAYRESAPIPPTRPLEERETPWRAMPDPALREELNRQLPRLARLLAAVVDEDPDAAVPWAGRSVPVGFFATHVRSEGAIHRWDLVGDDEAGTTLLADPALTAHAVHALGPLLVARDTQASSEAVQVRLRAPGQPDVVLARNDSYPILSLAEPEPDTPAIVCDPAARLLVLWGRQPADPGRIRTSLSRADYQVARALLAGY